MQTQVVASDQIQAIERLDFKDIMSKFAKHGWSPLKCSIAEKWYKRFLIIKVKYPEANLSPHGVVDEVWHYHILDTRRYMQDCDNIFGHYLHHAPTYGKGSTEPAKNKMVNYYLIEFGESPLDETLLEANNAKAECCQDEDHDMG